MNNGLIRFYACFYLEREINSVTERLKDDRLPAKERAALERALSDLKKDYVTISDMYDYSDDYDDNDCLSICRLCF